MPSHPARAVEMAECACMSLTRHSLHVSVLYFSNSASFLWNIYVIAVPCSVLEQRDDEVLWLTDWLPVAV